MGKQLHIDINPVFLLQMRVIRIITKADYYAPTHPIFVDRKILKVRDLIDLNTRHTIIYSLLV